MFEAEYLSDSPPPTLKTIIKPDPACTSCQGSGYVKPEGRTAFVKCGCIVKQEALQYLTDVYAGASYVKQFNPAQMQQHKLLRFEAAPQTTFKTCVKSFLLNTGMKYSHATVSAQDVLHAYLKSSELPDWRKLSSVDLLILYLVTDPKNGSYGRIMESLVESRNRHGLATWVYSKHPVSSPAFSESYQREFATYVSEHFRPFKLTSQAS